MSTTSNKSLSLRPLHLLWLVLGCPAGSDNDPPETSDPAPQSSSEGGGQSETGGVSPTTSEGDPSDTTGAVDPDGGSESSPPGTTSDTCNFICTDDTPSVGVQCDPFAQDCPDGQKCSAYAESGGNSWNATKCVPVAENPKQPGDACTVEGNGVSGIDDCDLGSYCWDTNAENIGTCVALCHGTPEAASCDDVAKTCAIYNEGVLNLCLDSCDPLAQDCDMADDVCIGNPSSDGFLCVLDASGEEGQQHDACEFANSCDPGLLCLSSTAASECDPASSGCCEPFCDLSDPNADADCGGVGQVCNPYYEENTAPPGQENIGYCAIPM
ncbi:MAG: ribulose phosphate epimerase [Myxococcales bacterium]|nr:ribulose phosphate epimerase [Myxococcales bacterium]